MFLGTLRCYCHPPGCRIVMSSLASMLDLRAGDGKGTKSVRQQNF